MSDCRRSNRTVLCAAIVLVAIVAVVNVWAGESSDRAWWADSWTPPQRYPEFARTAQYIPDRDGTRIATYLYLPSPLKAGEQVPTVLIITPYASELEYTWLGNILAENHPARADQILAERFARSGFATLLMDLPGSGASYGTKLSMFMPSTIRSGTDMLDWIVAQPWSDGKVGATGISAIGMTGNWLATAQHPALKAIAPRFTVFDIFYDLHPGGALANRFIRTVNRNVRLLDANRFTDMPQNWFSRVLARTLIKGIMPVDADHDRSQLAAAVAEHVGNEYFGSDIVAVTDRDDFLPGSSIPATLDTQSPHAYAEAIKASGVAIYAVGGWLDAAFGRAQINYFNALRTPGSTLTMGPWHHSGRNYASPFVSGEDETEFDQVADLIRFFDYHLRGVDAGGLAEGPPIHYFTLGEERWKSAANWPPLSQKRNFYFNSGNTLAASPGARESFDPYQVDHAVTTGMNSRFVAGTGYPNRKEADEKLLSYTSEPLLAATEVTGHPIITLYVSTNRPDGLFIVSLEDVDAEGNVQSVTEGILRGRHRRLSTESPPYAQPGPYRSYVRGDAAPVMSGEIMELTFDLFPVSYRFQQGHSVRIALSGADQDVFLPLPADTPPQAPPTWQVYWGGGHASFVELPVVD